MAVYVAVEQEVGAFLVATTGQSPERIAKKLRMRTGWLMDHVLRPHLRQEPPGLPWAEWSERFRPVRNAAVHDADEPSDSDAAAYVNAIKTLVAFINSLAIGEHDD